MVRRFFLYQIHAPERCGWARPVAVIAAMGLPTSPGKDIMNSGSRTWSQPGLPQILLPEGFELIRIVIVHP